MLIAAIVFASIHPFSLHAQTSNDFPASDPIVTPGTLDQDWNQQLNEALNRETIERSEVERIIEQEVDSAVNRNFAWTIGLLNTLLLLLIAMPIVGLSLLWLLRRSLMAKIVDELEQRIGEDLQTEFQRDRQDELRRDRLSDSDRRSATMNRSPTSSPADPSTSPSSNDGQATRLKEMVSMALSVQQTLSTAHQPLEESLDIPDQWGDRLDDLLDYHLDRAKQLERAAQHSEALAAYDQAIEIDPQNPIPHCARGALFVRLRRFDEAIAAFNRALEVQPDCAEACYGKACGFANLGHSDRAIVNLQAAIALSPELKNVAQSDPLLAAIRGQDWFQTEVVG